MHNSIPNTLALQVKNIHKRAIEIVYETTTTPALSTAPTYALPPATPRPTSLCILKINSLTRFMPTLLTSGFARQRSHSQTRFPRKFPALASGTYKKIPTARKSWSLALSVTFILSFHTVHCLLCLRLFVLLLPPSTAHTHARTHTHTAL